jgi:carbon monoxide dehydrogenase subunit G
VEFDNFFEVPLPPAEAWTVLMDIRRVAPCMPGAELTDVLDDRTYKGRIAVRLGPVALTFAGAVSFEEIDPENHRARIKAQGSDAKGRGGANAMASFRLEPAGTGTRVMVHTDLALSGAVAQYGRGVGMIQATAAQIINQFASNLKAQLGNSGPARPASPMPPSNDLVPATAGTQAKPEQATLDSRLRGNERPEPAVAPAAAPPRAAKPIAGFSLMARVLWSSIVRLFTRRPS